MQIAHAALIRDLVNQYAKSKDPFYCVRVTANDGEDGERFLREFQYNENHTNHSNHFAKTLYRSRCKNIRNIVCFVH